MLNKILPTSTRTTITTRLQAVKQSLSTERTLQQFLENNDISLAPILTDQSAQADDTYSSPSEYDDSPCAGNDRVQSHALSNRCEFSPIANPFTDEAYPLTDIISPSSFKSTCSLISIDTANRNKWLRTALVPRIRTRSLGYENYYHESVILSDRRVAAFKHPKQLKLAREFIGWFDSPGTKYRVHAGLDFLEGEGYIRSDRFQDHKGCDFEEYQRPGIYNGWEDMES